LGKVFWSGAVAALRGTDSADLPSIGACLHALERKQFVQRARRSSVADESEYAFRHALLRDVAYGQIPRAERAERHLRTAAWFETLGRPDEHAETLGYHYAAALELTRASGKPVDRFIESARLALRHAGERAFAFNAFPRAARFYADAAELWPRHDPGRPLLLLQYGAALQAVGCRNSVVKRERY